ncbi:hypothetical protein [Pseudoduganella umbonata]|uniref:Uncharacterized protein n=1 Tax=Pseudoduganella umbonata TaxID=864828 RepID=A0A4P8HR83_9BURK|nr:hypothetical protein [Pseudoduganella umbonata]MBB3222111.1 hypothetical protein [Pseudoduganella umbonata]QCP12349.1 hypothetical protein FCL38_19430 [Pseudoduganella umbonata]
MDHYDEESNELLQETIDRGYIEEGSAANGVARQCFDQGYDSLTDKQKAVYDLQVVPHLTKIVTERETEMRMRGMPD